MVEGSMNPQLFALASSAYPISPAAASVEATVGATATTTTGAAAAASRAPSAARLPIDLRCLAGLRALSSVAVVIFHCWLGLWMRMVPFETHSTLTNTNWIVRLASLGGPLGVDFFLILTGMLAAYQLVPLLEGSGKSGKSSSDGGDGGKGASPGRVVLTYWRRRALRLLPAYLATNLLFLLGVAPLRSAGLPPEAALARGFSMAACPRGITRNLLFLTNINLDISYSCGLHLWSLALQVQFYAAFPLLLCALRPRLPGFRTRLAAALAAAVAAGTAWRLWLVANAPALHLPLGDLAQPAELDAWITLLQTSYLPTGPRVAELAMGAALGLLLRSHGAVSWLLRRRGLVAAAAISLQAAFVHLSLHWHAHGLPGAPLWQPHTAQLFAALLYWGSPFIALLVSVTLLALVSHSDPLHSALASALSAPLFQPLSSLSFSLYLLHEPARLWGMLCLLPAGLLPALMAAAPVPSLLLLTAFTLACGYAAAYLMHHLVEKRF